MIEVRQTAVFRAWHRALRDQEAIARIAGRIERMQDGNFGDVKTFDGIGELRIDHGPGYRVYFMRRGRTVYLLLCGGDKSTQKRDIKRAKRMAREVIDGEKS
jgi:putative addiction module killer protein